MLNADVSVAKKVNGLPNRPKNDDGLAAVMLVVEPRVASVCANTPDALGIDTADVTVTNVFCNIVTAGLSAVELPPAGTVTSFDPQITISMGNSFGPLLTNNAVLTAFALGGDGGGKGWN